MTPNAILKDNLKSSSQELRTFRDVGTLQIHSLRVVEDLAHCIIRQLRHIYIIFYYVLLTVHLGIILVNNQLNAQFFMYVYCFYSLHVSGSHVPNIRRIIVLMRYQSMSLCLDDRLVCRLGYNSRYIYIYDFPVSLNVFIFYGACFCYFFFGNTLY